MLDKLRNQGEYFYSPNIKWNLTRFFLSLCINLNSEIDNNELLKYINNVGFCTDWSFINDNKEFTCKWDLRRVKNIRELEIISYNLIKFT